MKPSSGFVLSFLAAIATVMGARFLHATVLPDRPGLAFLQSLVAALVATIILARMGRGPFRG